MSKEKQIEELAEILRKVCDATPNGKCMSKLCCACRAETVIEAGYRKQSEAEWIGEADGYADGELVYDVWYCSECNHCIDDGTDEVDLLPNYCPNCGAKMGGGE